MKKIEEPQYYVSKTNMKTYNYRVYYMSFIEKIGYFVLAFIVGALVGYIFYGGIGKDELGNATKTTIICNAFFMIVTGTVAGILFLPVRVKSIIAKKKRNLILQFRELLDSLTTSLGSGRNVMDSFKAAQDDLLSLYDENTDIIKELQIIMAGLANNISIESMLLDFGNRSGIDDINSFAKVFETCYRKGGNIRDVIKNTKQILSDKMEVESEIQTIVTSSDNEQKIMTVLPIGLIGIIKLMSPDLAANYTSPAGIGATTFAIGLFVLSYFVGKKILNINI